MIKNLSLLVISIMLMTTMFSGCLDESDDSSDTDDVEEYYPPFITITSPRHNGYVSGTVEIVVSVHPADSNVNLEFLIDDVNLDATFNRDIEWNTSSVENGKHTITVSAREIGVHVPLDAAPVTRTITVKVDNPPEEEPVENTLPTIAMDVPTGDIGGVYRGPITLRGEVDDLESNIDTIEMMIDHEDWFDVPVSRHKWHYTLEPLTFTGEVDVSVRAYDGEDFSNIETITLDCDNTPPVIEFITPTGSLTISGITTLEVDVEEDHAVDLITFSVDGTELQSSPSETCEFDTTEYDNGEYELTIDAVDAVGNTDSRSIWFTIHNNHPPIADIKSPLEGAVFEEEDVITFDASYSSDPDGDDLTCLWESSLDGILSEEEVFSATLSPGEHTITLTVEDVFQEPSSFSLGITVNEHVNQYPEVIISEPEEGSLLNGEITVSGSATDPDGEITNLSYRIDDGNWTRLDLEEDWSFPLNTQDMEDGDHTMDVLATDDEEASAMDHITFTTDNTGPAVKIISPAILYVRGDVTIEADTHDDGSGIASIEFRIGNETVQQGDGSATSYQWDTTREEDGPEYTIEVIVRDSVGNEDNDTIIVQVDNTPPEIRGISPADGSYVSGDVSLEPALYDAQTGIDVVVFSLDGEEVRNSTARIHSWSTTGYIDGEHVLQITAYDKAGNSAEKGFQYLVDNSAPLVTITEPGDGEEIDGFGTISVDSEDTDGGSGVAQVRFFFNGLIQYTDSDVPYQFEFHSDDYADGDYTVTVISTDRAGNSAQDSIDIQLGDVPEPIITDPQTNYLSPYAVAGKERLIFDDYRAVPIVSSLVRNAGVMPSVNWDGAENPKDSLSITMPVSTGYAGYAGNIALSYWTDPGKTIVVDSYQHAVMMTAYASIMNYPIIIYDNSNPKITDEGLWKLGTTYANQIITLGNTPYNSQGVTVFQEDDLLDEQIGAAQFMGISLDYITVVNPDDVPSSSNTAYLSAFGGVFASHHQGLIIACPASSSQMNTMIHDAIYAMEAAGMPAEHICIVGDHISLPMVNSGGTPSDNTYADLDGDRFTIEISIGRVLAKELVDISYYVDRVVNYGDYLALQIGTPPLRMLDPLNWNNNAMIYMGWLAEFAEDSENHCREYMWALGRFNTQDDTDKAHSGLGTTLMMEDVAMSNLFIINADHGEPTGTVTWGSEHLPEMHPGVTFGVSCSLGRIDGVNKQASVTYTMMEQGMNVYLAPTRTAYGSFVQTYPYQPVAAPGLCYLYLTLMIDNDYDSGTAYMHAKNQLIENSWAGSVDQTTTWQYQHFGDPGFNPYEPANEGTPF